MHIMQSEKKGLLYVESKLIKMYRKLYSYSPVSGEALRLRAP
jgi:hypothetical protein